jgi:TfoX/Sxy family transcriptional regulator of competence genes
MAWVKVPKEHHPIFLSALPADRRVTTLPMFGGIGIKIGGNMGGGLFGRSAIVRLSEPDRAEALALDGATPFDPMGNGRTSSNMVMLPESIMDEPDELRAWLGKAIAFTAMLPRKAAKKVAKPAKPASATKAKTSANRAAAKPAAAAAAVSAKRPSGRPGPRAARRSSSPR